MELLSVLIAVVVVIGFAVILVMVATKNKSGKGAKNKNRTQIVREATHKLSQDPHNPKALAALGDIYFQEHSWEKAYQIYDTMLNIASSKPGIDAFLTSLRQGICAVKINKFQEALKGLSVAIQIDRSSFDAHYYMGLAHYNNNDFEKAIPFLKKAAAVRPEASNLNGSLGLALYKAKHYREALPFLRRALNDNPDNKEYLFSMATAMEESGYGNKAMKVFLHLRPDPEFGTRSSLAAGTIHMNAGEYDKAMQDFEIGMKHPNIQPEVAVELRYKYAQACFATKNISRGISLLYEIQGLSPNYKDVNQLISRYQELNQNKNLQIYLMSNSSDFVALCRKIVAIYYTKRAIVKIQDISVQQDYVEILFSVDSTKWEDTEIFRFYRTSGSIGELFIRDFHSRVSDSKADRGICFTAGTFTEEAKRYAEGRPVDLVGKDNLVKILKKIDAD